MRSSQAAFGLLAAADASAGACALADFGADGADALAGLSLVGLSLSSAAFLATTAVAVFEAAWAGRSAATAAADADAGVCGLTTCSTWGGAPPGLDNNLKATPAAASSPTPASTQTVLLRELTGVYITAGAASVRVAMLTLLGLKEVR